MDVCSVWILVSPLGELQKSMHRGSLYPTRCTWHWEKHDGDRWAVICLDNLLTWPMAKLFQLFGITYLVGKIEFKRLFQGPLAK